MGRAAIHPGKHLTEQLDALSLSQLKFARMIKIPVARVRDIIGGERPITVTVARRLARFFGTRPEFWLGLQAIYDRRLPTGTTHRVKGAAAMRAGK